MIDPTLIVEAIQNNGATWSSNHLVQGGTDYWLKVNGTLWELSEDSGDKKIRYPVFSLIAGLDGNAPATVNSDNTLTTSAGVFQLAVAGAYAHLIDPVF